MKRNELHEEWERLRITRAYCRNDYLPSSQKTRPTQDDVRFSNPFPNFWERVFLR